MKAISTAGFAKPEVISAGTAPILRWLPIAELFVDPAYNRPILSKGRRTVERIARNFTWSCFAPVVVAAAEGGKFAIIDGLHRTTAAALVGFESVPCQIVTATREEQAVAFKVINRTTTPVSNTAFYAAGLVASESWAVRLAEVCVRAEVQLLRYPVPVDRQSTGQTMAIATLAQCLKRYGEETLITALQCVTQTTNNRPGALSARMIKALCAVLGGDPVLRDSGLALLEAFDAIDLMALAGSASVDAVAKGISPVQAIANRIRAEVSRVVPRRAAPQSSVEPSSEISPKNQIVFEGSRPSARGSGARRLHKS
jgi:hypothetical protein